MTNPIIPSCLLKLERAEKHLVDFEQEISAFCDSHPYAVRDGMEGKRKVHRLHFSSRIDPRVFLIASDFLYNIRSALEHLACSLVPKSQWSHVGFPIFWHGVWDDPKPGENQERLDARQRWNTYVRFMDDGAVAILKTLQPRDGARDTDLDMHYLGILSRLSNTDRHKDLAIYALGLKEITVTYDVAPNSFIWRPLDADVNKVMHDGTELPVPPNAVNVQIEGRPIVAIRVTKPKGEVIVPAHFRAAFPKYRDQIIIPLLNFVNAGPKGKS
jgi:hypothetical protein